MDLDSTAVFEIRDFSVASPFERLAALLESLLRRWASLAAPAEVEEPVETGRRVWRARLRLRPGTPLSELRDSCNDFAPRAPPLARWFGPSSYVLLEAGPAELGEARLLLSAAAVAVAAVPEFDAPVYVAYGRGATRDYLGFLAGGQGEAHFVEKALPLGRMGGPPTLKWLAAEFSRRHKKDEKQQQQQDDEERRVSVAVHCTWKTSTNPHGGWLEPVAIRPGSYHQETPWGPDLDPVLTLAFSTTAQLAVEHGTVADERAGQDPEQAPHWSLLCQVDSNPFAPLTDSVRMLLQAMSEAEGFKSMKDALHDQRLGRSLLEPMLLPTADEVNRMIAELFAPAHPSTAYFSCDSDLLLEVKSAPPLTLLASLCMYMLNLEGLPGVALVWAEFVKELRFHWDHFTELPRTGLPGAEPHRFCKMFQRLQMLNWCIMQRRERNETARKAALGGWANEEFDSVSSSGEEHDEPKEEKGAEDKTTSHKGEGVKSELSISLLKSAGQVRVREPFTQDQCAVTTEDMIEEQQALLLSMGDDKRGSEMRAEMQSRSLLSDMEAFRAANPEDCVLEDFVRWHSPRDWIVDDEGVVDGVGSKEGEQEDGSWVFRDNEKLLRGRLSSRMGESGNLWKRLWSEARAMPVSRQKPLIDHVREGERILNIFEHMPPFQLLQECVLVSMTSVWHMFRAYPAAQVPVVSRQIASMAAALIEVGGTRGYVGEFGPEDLAASVGELQKLESVAAAATSLLCKLSSSHDLTNALLKDGSGGVPVPLDHEAERAIVMKCLQRSFAEEAQNDGHDNNDDMPSPHEREYILRCGSDRLYASIDSEIVRMASVTFVKK